MNKLKNKNYERYFHDEYIAGDSCKREKQVIFYSEINQNIENDYVFEFFGNLNGKKILFYGSGGHYSLLKEFIDRGAYVVAIDISPKTVEKLKQRVKRELFSDKCDIIEMDCEKLNFPDNSFDFVFGRSIVHHLDIDKFNKGVYSVMKKGGKGAFIEPLSTNPLISIYRKLTPKDRTPDEQPLTICDLDKITQVFSLVKFNYLYFFAILPLLFRAVSNDEILFRKLFYFFYGIDNSLLMLFPSLYKFLCWDVLIYCEK